MSAETIGKIDGMAAYFRKSSGYKYSIEGMLNLYQLSIEGMLGMLREGGEMGVICPSTLFADVSATTLRKHLLSKNVVSYIRYFSESDSLFDNGQPVRRPVSSRFLTISSSSVQRLRSISKSATPSLLGRFVSTLIKPYLDSYNFVDLFAGCGGLPEGFLMNGFNLLAANEVDKNIIQTNILNHSKYAPKISSFLATWLTMMSKRGYTQLAAVTRWMLYWEARRAKDSHTRAGEIQTTPVTSCSESLCR